MSTINATELESVVTEAIARESGNRFVPIRPDSKLDDYEIDETGLAMISLQLETKLDIEIPEDLLSGSSTVREVVLRLTPLMANRDRKPGLWKAAQSFFSRKASRVA